MVRTPSRSRLPRILAMLTLAYVLAVNGILGAMAAGAHVGDARLAAQLGVICTIHGIADGGEAQGTGDPTPGKLACIEHCTLAGGTMVGALPQIVAGSVPQVSPVRTGPLPRSDRFASLHSTAIPPPPRGPPSVI